MENLRTLGVQKYPKFVPPCTYYVYTVQIYIYSYLFINGLYNKGHIGEYLGNKLLVYFPKITHIFPLRMRSRE